jgi:ferredoxin
MKNLFGLLSRETRAKIHAVNLDRGIVNLGKVIRPLLTVVDASSVLECAVFGAEKEGATAAIGGIIAGEDVLAVDRYCCELIGLAPDSIGHISWASRDAEGSKDFHLICSESRKPRELGSYEVEKKGRLHRFGYRVVYALDILLSHFLGAKSVVPFFHFYLGVRPKIIPKACNQCGDCLSVCAMHAIDLRKKRILASRCMNLRCLQCYQRCRSNAITLRGYRASRLREIR